MNFTEFRRSPGFRIGVLFCFYAFTLAFAWQAAYQVRYDFEVPASVQKQSYKTWLLVIPVKLVFLYLFGQFSGLLGYFSVPDVRRLFFASAAGLLVLLGIRLSSGAVYPAPVGVLLLDFLFSFTGVAVIRLGFRMMRESYWRPRGQARRRAKRTGIIGAGEAGAKLARELAIKRALGLQPVAFFDDNPTTWRSRVHDVPVVGPPESLLDPQLNWDLEEVIIAMPSAPAKRIGEVVKILQRARLKFKTVPSLDQLATGQVKVSQLRSVEIQDLLGREPVQLELENIREIIRARVVMVTGAGGSIGSELCRQIASFEPEQLLLVEQSDEQIMQIEEELNQSVSKSRIVPLVADVLDLPRMRSIFERFQPAVVFHAAAHKHVPMMESQPCEAIKNNTLGTARVAELALEFGVNRFVLISSDKAINPTNVMGATKRMAEIFLQALHASQPGRTKFMAVRFGNVLGSSGSVIPTFKNQISTGGPVKVTHPEMTRYFMTIPEAVGLVLQSAAQGVGGEIFVLDMGKPVKIVDLARQLIELSGLKPGEDIQIVFTGLRPGEKLFEELSHKGENISTTHHPKIMRFVSEPLPLGRVREQLRELTGQLHEAEPNQLKLLLKNAVPEYRPYLN